MNPVQRFFRRYITSTIGILLLFFAVNIALLLGILTAGYMSGPEEDVSIQEIQAHLTLRDGIWTADETVAISLQENDAWAMLLDQNGAVIWEQGMPEELPRVYTSAGIAAFSRWYLQDYPVKVWGQPDGRLMVVGFAPGTQAKYYFSMETSYLKMLLVGAAMALLINLLLLISLFLRNTRRVEKAMSPILQGIQDMSRGQHHHLEECGELAEINAGLNRAGEYLMQKDNTRAEWIRGVSHDIRTPLSMVLGYASELEDNDALPTEARQQAGIIRRQGERLKSLVDDLNLTTKLEYALQPVRREAVDLVETVRQAVSEVLNSGLPDQYELEFSENRPGCTTRMEGDAALLRRMLDNLLRNSVVHNPQGCHISVAVGIEDGRCTCTVTDDGAGIDAVRLDALNQGADISSTQGGEHGLGLKLVRQIVKAHGGTVRFRQAVPQGLEVFITFPEHSAI
ncbi:MAG: HAMP domain-containing histidine kinase [Oscillospiraceae bacterium]|nr:HAMP domain-containing histidine kinase [Oscillospiraceae bacterium]